MLNVISIIVGYLVGCFQTSYIIGKTQKHLDIREHGSGNAGSTNAVRVMGWKYGLMTFFGDLIKAVLAVLICWQLTGSQNAGLLAGLGVVLGHNWPIFLGFKGGKGIASTLGLILAFDVRIGLVIWAIAAILIFTTKYVSLGSLVLVTLFPVSLLIFHTGNYLALAVSLILMTMGYYRHRANIQRLLKGTENKLSGKKDKTEKEA